MMINMKYNGDSLPEYRTDMSSVCQHAVPSTQNETHAQRSPHSGNEAPNH